MAIYENAITAYDWFHGWIFNKIYQRRNKNKKILFSQELLEAYK